MTKSNIRSFAVLVTASMPFVCTAADLLDAPGPGYFQQGERLSPPRHVVVAPKISIQIYPANGAFSTKSLTEMEQTFADANRLFQSPSQSSEVEVSGTVKPQPMRSAPKTAQ